MDIRQPDTGGGAGASRSSDLLPQFALLVAAVLLGSSFVAARAIMDHSDSPATLGFLRYILAAVCLLPLVLRRAHWQMRRTDVGLALGLGVLQFGLFHLFVNTALQEIPAARGAVIFALVPILTMLIAAAGGRDSLSWIMTVAAALSFAGVSLVVGEKAFSPSVGGDSLWGEGLFFLAVCCGATYNAFSARLYQRYSVAAVSMLAMLGGVITLLPFAVAEGLFTTGPGYTTKDWWLGVYLAVFGGTASMLLFNWGLQQMSPTRAAIWVPMSPIAATAFGALLLDEIITPLFMVGLVCAVAGPLLVSWGRGRRQRNG
ncbi:MAG: DMT family transporter [Minwuia sp.]|nr:DMT family transporter [Minwuia sp.]